MCKFPSEHLLTEIIFSASEWFIPKSENSTLFYFSFDSNVLVLHHCQKALVQLNLYRILTMKTIEKQLKALGKIESIITWNLWSHRIVKAEYVSHIVFVFIKSRSCNKSENLMLHPSELSHLSNKIIMCCDCYCCFCFYSLKLTGNTNN